MRKYSGEHFVKIDDVRSAPIQGQIVEVKEGKYDKADLVFESGDVLSLNATNTQILIRAYGTNSDYWVGKMVEMFLGKAKYNGTYNDSVLVRAISSSPKDANADKAPDQDKSPSDEIPF
jgi:hypothetical protein